MKRPVRIVLVVLTVGGLVSPAVVAVRNGPWELWVAAVVFGTLIGAVSGAILTRGGTQ